MATHRMTNVLLTLIVGALVAIVARLPGPTASAAEEPRRPAFGDYVGFAVDNGGFFILDPRKNQMYRYDRRGRVLQIYDIRTLGEDFKVSYGSHTGAGSG